MFAKYFVIATRLVANVLILGKVINKIIFSAFCWGHLFLLGLLFDLITFGCDKTKHEKKGNWSIVH